MRKSEEVPSDLTIVLPFDHNTISRESVQLITDNLVSKGCDGLKRHFFVSTHMPHDSTQEHYVDIIVNVSIVYHVSHRLADSEPEVAAWIDDHDSLCRFMTRIDECGISENLTPEMTPSKHRNVLARLDADRAVFKGIVQEAVNELTPEHDILVFFLYFASMIFEFNGYQAPMRWTPRNAVEDAYGLTDLWGELLREVGYDEEEETK